MSARIEADICVIGAGSGGLSVAAGASQLGARTVLVERGKMGGECLNYGCVPSKALIAAAHAAENIRRAGRFGVHAGIPAIDFGAVHHHVHGVIAAIAPHDSEARFIGLGVTVLRGAARFTGTDEIAVGDRLVRARRFVIATGSSPAMPPVAGLGDVPYLTNETVFDLRACPEHLLILGGGPIGIELAQAFRRLGARVTVAEAAAALGREDPEAAALLCRVLRAEGIDVREHTAVQSLAASGGGIVATLFSEGQSTRIAASHLLIAAGRKPNVADLGLENAGVAYSDKGILVDDRLRSSNPHVYAIGDVAGGMQFTHLAGYHAGIAIANALFRWPRRVRTHAIPRVTYADPELAQVGLTEAEAGARGDIRILRWALAENDRARAGRATDGLIKAIVTPRGKILGATILAPQAGELILPWVLALDQGLNIRALADMVAPYPTLGEVSKRAAASFFLPKLFTERTRRLVRFLARFG